MSADDGPAGGREVAYRLFAAEFEDADFSHTESDEERAPNYVITPTGARVNRLFVVGVLTAVERVGEDVLRARVVDPTGAFVVYAGQYQPDATAFLDDADPPAFVAVTGKARTFQPDDADRIYTSVRPETVSEVDAETRDRWVVRTAEHTLERVATMADALDRPERGDALADALADAGVSEGLAAGVPLAVEHYGTTRAYLAALRTLALDAVEVVTGDRDEAGTLSLSPDAAGSVEVDLSFGGVAGDAEERPAATTADDVAGTVAEESGADSGSGTVAATDVPAAEAAGTDGEDAASGTGTDEPDRGGDDATAEGEGGADREVEDGTEDEAPSTGEEAAEEFELDAGEREAVVEEHGVEFSTGSEIPDAGESDIDTPDADEVAAEVENGSQGAAASGGDGTDPDAAGSDGETTDDDSGEDLQDVVVERMRELGDDGVDRDELVASVTADQDVTADAVESAVQGALMAGRCYESGEDELTPI